MEQYNKTLIESEIEKSIKFYRRCTLGLIPVTIFMEDLVINRAINKIKEDSP